MAARKHRIAEDIADMAAPAPRRRAAAPLVDTSTSADSFQTGQSPARDLQASIADRLGFDPDADIMLATPGYPPPVKLAILVTLATAAWLPVAAIMTAILR